MIIEFFKINNVLKNKTIFIFNWTSFKGTEYFTKKIKHKTKKIKYFLIKRLSSMNLY